MNGERVGVWHTGGPTGHRFAYDDTRLRSENVRPISLSMPLRPAHELYQKGVEAFFENLLPDNPTIRERLQRRHGTRSTNAFDLLAEIGRDCVGALQILPEDAKPKALRSITAVRLTRTQVAEVLSQTLGHPAGIGDIAMESRLSLAGAQEKTALLWHDGAWNRPLGATPTTHILKLPIGTAVAGLDLSTSVENEWLCGQILRAYGIPMADSRMDRFGEYRVLVVERFDRRLAPDGSWWMRLPQEDLCQATGTPPARKYESEGGPGILQVMDLLRGSDESVKDREDFMRTQLLFWMLAAIDGHAKNFSVFLLSGGGYRLTPRYDVLSAHPVMGHGRGKLSSQKIRMAMAVLGRNRHYRWAEIEFRHWLETVRRSGFTGMSAIRSEIIERTPTVIDTVRRKLSKDYPDFLATTILDGLKRQVGNLKLNH